MRDAAIYMANDPTIRIENFCNDVKESISLTYPKAVYESDRVAQILGYNNAARSVLAKLIHLLLLLLLSIVVVVVVVVVVNSFQFIRLGLLAMILF